MKRPKKILDHHAELLTQTPAVSVFSDVFSHDGPGIPDFDAILTTQARSLLPPVPFQSFGIGNVPAVAPYAAQVLVDSQSIRSTKIKDIFPNPEEMPDQVRTIVETTFHGVINIAPRSSETPGDNGGNFLLAISDNGVPIWVSSEKALELMATRRRITALFEWPNEENPIYRRGEQFRSSVITLARFFPEKLKPRFQSQEEISLPRHMALDLERLYEKVFGYPPMQIENFKLVWVDHFGNVRVNAKSNWNFEHTLETQKSCDDVVGIGLGDYFTAKTVRARLVKSLSEIPLGEIGLYRNVADVEFTDTEFSDFGGEFEVVRRVADPNSPTAFSAGDVLAFLADLKSRHQVVGGSFYITHPDTAQDVSDILSAYNSAHRLSLVDRKGRRAT